jgi:hypothetical protein
VRAKIFALDPHSFELLVQQALERTGFVEVSVTRYTADNGIDVNARVSPVQWPIADVRVQVQAKRWLHTVGRREVAELRGSLEPFAQGAVVTTSFFSLRRHRQVARIDRGLTQVQVLLHFENRPLQIKGVLIVSIAFLFKPFGCFNGDARQVSFAISADSLPMRKLILAAARNATSW